MNKIYMDHAATTPLDPKVLEAMRPYLFEKYGNASSVHSMGQEAKDALDLSRAKVAKVINASTDNIIFTSGGTESDNMAITGGAMANKKKGNHIITSAIEHHAVLNTCQALEKWGGYKVTYLPVNKNGLVKPQDVESAITKDTTLVSIMHANNEIGTIEPVKEIGKICKEKGVFFHTDAVQTIGKLPVDVKKLNIDLLSASAHKFYGPKGSGFLYRAPAVEIWPITFGGGHEYNLRPGTENIPGIVGLANALELSVKDMDKENERLRKLSNRLTEEILKIPNSWLNGHPTKRLAGTNNFGFDFIEGESLVIHLDLKGVEASTGSACSSKSLEPSHVLTAIGLSHVKAHGSLRLTLGKSNTKEHVDHVLEVLPGIVENLRRISPLGKR